MKRKCILVCLLILLFSLLIIAKFLSKDQIKFSFSPLATNPTNLIDINELTKEDYKQVFEGDYNDVHVRKGNSSKQVYYHDKPLISFKLSPTKKQAFFSYHPDDVSNEDLSLVLINLDSGQQKEIFHTTFSSWDVRSDVHWLGNNHLFFLRHCGTACQGITLLNIETGETINALLSYPSFPDQLETTFFQDWFGAEYEMDGLVVDVNSKTNDNIHYLIFSLEDYEKNNMGQKRFLFTGDGLIEVE